VPKQTNFDGYVNSGGGQFFLRKNVQNNPEPIPMGPLPSDFGLLGWSIDPIDVNVVNQAIVSGTQYFVRLPSAFNANLQNGNQVAKVGVQIGTTAAATPGAYSGLALYSYVPGAATMAKLADTGADNGAAWVTAGASNYLEGSLSSKQSFVPGYLYVSFIATFTTTPTLWANTLTPNQIKIKGVTIQQSYSLAAQSSFASSVTVSGLTAGTFVPLVGIA
jgi:hypothetical protein